MGIFVTGERDDREPLAYAADKEYGLLCTDPMLARHPRERGIDLGQTMRSAAARGLVELNEQIQARPVMDVIAIEHRHQHRSIKKSLHSPLPRFARSRSPRICCSMSSVAEAGRGSPEWNTQTPCSLVSGPVPRTGRKVICSPTLSISRESPASRCSSCRSG